MAPLVLIVEDFEDARELYSEYLQHVGLEVISTGNAIDGIRLARARHPARPTATAQITILATERPLIWEV